MSIWYSAGQIEQVGLVAAKTMMMVPAPAILIGSSLSGRNADANVTFCFIETGTVFIKDGRRYHSAKQAAASRMACESGMNFQGSPFILDS